VRDHHPCLALAFGPDHFDDLPPAGDEIGQQPRCHVRQRTWFGFGRLGEVGDDRGVDRITLGMLADRLGEGPDLGWVDDNDRELRGRQRRRRDRLEAAGGFEGDDVRRKLSQPGRQLLQAGGITLDHEYISTRTHGDIEVVLGNVDTNGDAVHGDPSLPNRASRFAAPATVRVRWNDGRGTKLSHGL
jgi:hypothetical protein